MHMLTSIDTVPVTNAACSGTAMHGKLLHVAHLVLGEVLIKGIFVQNLIMRHAAIVKTEHRISITSNAHLFIEEVT